MNALVDSINIVLPFFYGMSFAAYVYDFVREKTKLPNVKRLFLFFTLLLHSLYLMGRTIAFSHPPITNVFEIFTVIAFAITFSYFVLELVTDIRGTGAFIIVISLIFQVISSLFIQDLLEVREVLRSNLLGIHVVSALIGYAGITLSAVYGFLYLQLYKELKQRRFGLIFERLPNLEILETLNYYSAVIGFILLTVAMIIGIIWLPRAFPHFSYTDPKLIATGIVWLLYGIGITAKMTGKWQGRKVIVFSIAGFLLAICSTIVTNFISRSFHSFY